MAPEMKILAEFPRCYQCGSEETISQLAMRPLIEAGKYPIGTFSQLKQEIVPLEQPPLAGVAVPCIVSHFDVCAGCGKERLTRSEIIRMPLTMTIAQQGGNNGGIFHK